MQVKTQEHAELIKNFEKTFTGQRYDKEPKELWAKGAVYQNGELNKLFLAFRQGYALAKCTYQ